MPETLYFCGGVKDYQVTPVGLILLFRHYLYPPLEWVVELIVLGTTKFTLVEMSFISSGTVLDGDKCIPQSQCPCHYRGVSYQEGQVVKQSCKTW